MSKMQKIKLPSGSTIDINDERIHIYRSLTGVEGKQAGESGVDVSSFWNVTDSNISAYKDGMVVCLKVPVAGSDYGVGFQINELGLKPVVYDVNSSIGTRYSVGSVVWAVYNATQTAPLYLGDGAQATITGVWQVMDCVGSGGEIEAITEQEINALLEDEYILTGTGTEEDPIVGWYENVACVMNPTGLINGYVSATIEGIYEWVSQRGTGPLWFEYNGNSYQAAFSESASEYSMSGFTYPKSMCFLNAGSSNLGVLYVNSDDLVSIDLADD